MKIIRFAHIFNILAMVAVLAVAGVAAQSRTLAGGTWHLTELLGQRVTGSKAILGFDHDLTRFTGSTGCNRMSGGVSVDGRRIAFSRIATTRMFCPGDEEGRVLAALGNATHYKLDNRTMVLKKKGRRVAVFTRMPDGARNSAKLGDRKWMLEQIGNRQTFVALPTAFINFDTEKASVGGDTSCNVFGGKYSVKGDKIKFTDLISTMRACVEDNRMTVEREFLDGLRDADRFVSDGDRLQLYKGRKLLLTFRGTDKSG